MQKNNATGRVIFVFLILLPLCFADTIDPDMLLYNDMLLELKIQNTIHIDALSPQAHADYVAANLSWFPQQDYRQKIQTLTTTPIATQDINMEFRWERPQGRQFDIHLQSTILTSNDFVPVTNKISFPIKNTPYAFKPYLEPQLITDSSPEITALAKELTEGTDDLYQAVFALADWVKENVNYNLSTITADAAKESSWVLENRQGVCDEITSLFISLCRSVGIPAKFISGMSYSDLEAFNYQWGPHGWAEVYFPLVGWVPFDVTYRQMGYLDSTHIKLKEGLDAKDNSIEYLSRGRDIRIRADSLLLSVRPLQKGEKSKPVIDLSVHINKEKAGFGSYNMMWAEVSNNQNHYVTADITLSRTEELELISGQYKTSILLKPYETKNVYWIVRVTEKLMPGYTYTFPVEVRDIRGAYATNKFTSSKQDPIFTYNEFKEIMPKSYERQKSLIELDCSTPKQRYEIGSIVTVECLLKNLEPATRRFEICIEEQCQEKRVLGENQDYIWFKYPLEKQGINNLVITAEHGTEQKRSYILLDVLVKPEINITKIEYPEEMEFAQEGKILFTIRKNDDSIARKVNVQLIHDKIRMEKELNEMNAPQEFSILFYGSNLKAKNNNFQIRIDYEDDQGQTYRTIEDFSINLKNLTFFQKFMLFVDDMEARIFRR